MPKGKTNGNGHSNGNSEAIADRVQRYRRALEQNETRGDSALRSPDTPPNFGRLPIPQIFTFGSRLSTLAQVYRNPDEAVKDSLENARFMRNDPAIMECLEARQRSVALLNWHLEPEDKDDQTQKALVNELTLILKRIPNFTEYRRNLLEAIWYGRSAIQHAYGFERIKKQRRTILNKWRPINGDKLAFRWDDGSGKFSDDDVGIKVGVTWSLEDKLAGNRTIEFTDFGPAYFLEPWERTRIALHRHIIEDGAYEDPISAGRIHGVGVRDRIYWTWYQKQETMATLMELIERTGTGFTIYYYPDGNMQAKTQVESLAEKQKHDNILVMPRMPGDPAADAYGIERIEPSTAGISAMKEIIHEFFGHQMKRYILGQILSSESASTGLGSGVADLHQDTFMLIVQYDAVKLEETLTRDLVKVLQNFNFPEFRDVNIAFKIDTGSNESEKKMSGYKQAWDMGAKIRAVDVMDAIGASMPSEDEETLVNPTIMQQLRLWRQQQKAGQQAGAEPGSPEDMFGPLAEMVGGQQGAEGGEMGGEMPPEGPGGMPPDGGEGGPEAGPADQGPTQYAKRKPEQGELYEIQRRLNRALDGIHDETGTFCLGKVSDFWPLATNAAGVNGVDHWTVFYHGAEASAVVITSGHIRLGSRVWNFRNRQNDLAEVFTRAVMRLGQVAVERQLYAKKFEPDKHPRDENGKFSHSDAVASDIARTVGQQALEAINPVVDQEQLDDLIGDREPTLRDAFDALQAREDYVANYGQASKRVMRAVLKKMGSVLGDDDTAEPEDDVQAIVREWAGRAIAEHFAKRGIKVPSEMVRYAKKRVKPAPGQLDLFSGAEVPKQHAIDWKEELHPRGEGGKFAPKGEGAGKLTGQTPAAKPAEEAFALERPQESRQKWLDIDKPLVPMKKPGMVQKPLFGEEELKTGGNVRLKPKAAPPTPEDIARESIEKGENISATMKRHGLDHLGPMRREVADAADRLKAEGVGKVEKPVSEVRKAAQEKALAKRAEEAKAGAEKPAAEATKPTRKPVSKESQLHGSLTPQARQHREAVKKATGLEPWQVSEGQYSVAVDPTGGRFQIGMKDQQERDSIIGAALIHYPEQIPDDVLREVANRITPALNELQDRNRSGKHVPMPTPAKPSPVASDSGKQAVAPVKTTAQPASNPSVTAQSIKNQSYAELPRLKAESQQSANYSPGDEEVRRQDWIESEARKNVKSLSESDFVELMSQRGKKDIARGNAINLIGDLSGVGRGKAAKALAEKHLSDAETTRTSNQRYMPTTGGNPVFGVPPSSGVLATTSFVKAEDVYRAAWQAANESKASAKPSQVAEKPAEAPQAGKPESAPPTGKHAQLLSTGHSLEGKRGDTSYYRTPGGKEIVRVGPDEIPRFESYASGWDAIGKKVVLGQSPESISKGEADQPSAEEHDRIYQELKTAYKDPKNKSGDYDHRQKIQELESQLEFHKPAAIARAQAEIDAEKAAKNQPLSANPSAPYITAADLAEHYKSSGIPRHLAWDKFVKDTILQPSVRSDQIDARDFFKAYDSISSATATKHPKYPGGQVESLPGGKADKQPDSDFPADKLAQGAEVESEHTSDPAQAKEIAKDHLTEDTGYYDKLAEMEAKPKTPAKAERVGPQEHPGNGSIVTDDQGNEWLVMKARHGIVEGAPIIDGKAVVNRDSIKQFVTDPNKGEVGPPLYKTGRDYYAEQEGEGQAKSETPAKGAGAEQGPEETAATPTKAKEPWEMTSDEFERSKQGDTYGDWYFTPDGKYVQMRGSGGMGSNRVGTLDINGKHAGYYNRDELRLANKAPRETASTKAADEWLADVSSNVEKLRKDNEKLLLGKKITEQFRSSLAKGKMTQDQFDNAVRNGTILSDAEYEKSRDVENQIQEAQQKPLEVPENKSHKEAVKFALAAGKPVPPEVLKDYPDLQAATQALTSEQVESLPGEPGTQFEDTLEEAKKAGAVPEANPVAKPLSLKEQAKRARSEARKQADLEDNALRRAAQTPLGQQFIQAELRHSRSGKMPHQMTVEEVAAANGRTPEALRNATHGTDMELLRDHKRSVVNAIRHGLHVSPEVLAGYPELQPQETPAMQAAIRKAHESLHKAGLAEKPEEMPIDQMNESQVREELKIAQSKRSFIARTMPVGEVTPKDPEWAPVNDRINKLQKRLAQHTAATDQAKIADEERRRKEFNDKEERRQQSLPTKQRRNGWEMATDGTRWYVRDPHTKEIIYSGTQKRSREVADESAPDVPEK